MSRALHSVVAPPRATSIAWRLAYSTSTQDSNGKAQDAATANAELPSDEPQEGQHEQTSQEKQEGSFAVDDMSAEELRVELAKAREQAESEKKRVSDCIVCCCWWWWCWQKNNVIAL
jgi:hypothetical protein